ncbi:aldo/keto reductase [Desulfotomaculum sp. 1211_IL3151]|uniref:aldo/keto reductase n=1 Tax=Desulfotomaculum sp. 1211_IL3151 TaxID=3084055 RepID=UPI002FDB4F9B
MLVERLTRLAEEKQVTVSQLAYAWMLSKGQDIIPLIGASKVAHFQEAVESLKINLSEADINRIENAIPEAEIAGASFPNMQFKNGRVVRK